LKALVKENRKSAKLKLKEIDKPEIANNEVLIEVKAVGICGTDVHILNDEFDYSPPVVLGHEVAGVIREIGSDVDNVKLEERVTTETYYCTCHQCIYCKSGMENMCKDRLSIGSKKNGGFAEYLKVPANNIHKVPENTSLEEASLVEPLSCCVNGILLKRKIMPTDTVIIFGPGTIGLICMQLVKINGGNAIVCGTKDDRERLSIAKELGADEIIFSENLNDLNNENVDVVIEASGAKHAVNQGLKLLRKNGRFIQMGIIGEPIEVNWDYMLLKELDFWGPNATVKKSWEVAIKLLEQNKVNLKPLITHEYSLEQWEEAFENFKMNKGVKNIFKPN